MASKTCAFTQSNGTAWTAANILDGSGTWSLNNIGTAQTSITQDVQTNEGRILATAPTSGSAPGYRRAVADNAGPFAPTDTHVSADFRPITGSLLGMIPGLLARQPTGAATNTHYRAVLIPDAAGKNSTKLTLQHVDTSVVTTLASCDIWGISSPATFLAHATDYTLELWTVTRGSVVIVAMRLTADGSRKVAVPWTNVTAASTRAEAHDTASGNLSSALVWADGAAGRLTAAGRTGILQGFNALSAGTFDLRWDDYLAEDWVGITGPATMVTETEAALALGRGNAAARVTETEEARPLGRGNRAGIATEVEEARPLGRARALGTAAELEIGVAITAGAERSRALGTATEEEEAIAFGRARPLGVALESELALELNRAGARALGTATETEDARALGHTRMRLLGTAVETEAAGELLAPVTDAQLVAAFGPGGRAYISGPAGELAAGEPAGGLATTRPR